MATKAQISNFIKLIAPDVQLAYKKLGKVKPSVCIGMACVESGAGTSKLMSSHNALWGQKVGTGRTATKYWGGKFYVAKTKEEYTVGQHTVIKGAFRSYDSVLQGACNFYELLNTSLYSKVRSDQTYEEQMRAIKACGYMTSSTEVNSVLSYINNFALTKYDFADDFVETGDNPYKLTHKLLKQGMKNESVKWLQFELNRLGYALATDGNFGPRTKAAVVSYQRARALVPDGIVGAKTFASLGVK
jgi:flagellum-specific peptidoglycan hydrolase FlgJ